MDRFGYVLNFRDGRLKREHIEIAERALGHQLPPAAVVHHVNGLKGDNRQTNLVICPNQAYHTLLHQRMRARDACGNPDWKWCFYCRAHDAPENIYARNGGGSYHKACHSAHARKRKAATGLPTMATL